MFEIVIAVCVAAGTPCRDQLVPGPLFETAALCEAALVEAPEGAKCVGAGQALAVVEIAPGVFVNAGAVAEPDSANGGDVANLGFVIGEKSVAVIDTGSSRAIGEGLWRAIRGHTDKPVSHVVLTHMHPDHVLGTALFSDAGAEVIGHDRLPRALLDRQGNYLESLERLVGTEAFLGTMPPVVAQTVSDDLQIDLGGRILTLTAWPNAHTGTDLTVMDEATGTLFTGDLVFDRHTPALDGSLRGWQSVLEQLMEMPVQRIVPGHGATTLEWPEGGDALARYLDRLASDTASAIEAGERLGDAITHIAGDEAPHWELFEVFNPRNATVAFTELEWE